MRVKSHQLPMTMRRATDPRMESLPADGEGWGWLGGCSGDIRKADVSEAEEKTDCVQFHFNSKARVAKVSAFQITVCKCFTHQA